MGVAAELFKKGGMMRSGSFGIRDGDRGALMLVQPGLVHAQEQAQAQAPVQPQTPMAMMEAAANRGDAIAQTNLGIAHEFGYGVAQNPQEAVKWYQRAATQGDVRAQFYLSGCYEMGTGVAQDFVQAYYWLSVAVANSSTRQQRLCGDDTAPRSPGAYPP
jgi:TPR repeat protein